MVEIEGCAIAARPYTAALEAAIAASRGRDHDHPQPHARRNLRHPHAADRVGPACDGIRADPGGIVQPDVAIRLLRDGRSWLDFPGDAADQLDVEARRGNLSAAR